MPKVTLAYPYVDADGKNHAPDTTIDLEAPEANRLLHYGLARETSAPADTDKKG